MKYQEFKEQVIKAPLILSRDLCRLQKAGQLVLNQLNRWQRKKLIIRLKKGLYILNEQDRKINPSRYFISNQLYGPSYVSLESALSFYGIIPEKVSDLTAVTTKKTAAFKNELGTFIYQHVKLQAFRGFKTAKDNSGLTFFIAEPEKAVLDFIYLNLKKIPVASKDIFGESFRFQNLRQLRHSKIAALAGLFDNKKMRKLTKDLCELVKKEGGR